MLVLPHLLPWHGHCMGTETPQAHVQCDVHVVGCTYLGRHACIEPISCSAAVLNVLDSALVTIKDTVGESACNRINMH